MNTSNRVLVGAACLTLLVGGLALHNVPAHAQKAAPRFGRMNQAIANMERAKTNLVNSINAYPGDQFEGHRANALKLLNQAEDEAKAALASKQQ